MIVYFYMTYYQHWFKTEPNLNKIEELRTLADNMKNIISDLNKLFN